MSIYGKDIFEECDIVNISPETIQEMINYFGQFDYAINEAVINPTEILTKIFTKLNVAQNKQKIITNAIKSTSSDIINNIMKNGINKQSRSFIAEKMSDLKSYILDILGNVEYDMLEFANYDANKIIKSFVLVLLVSIANSIVIVLCTTLFPGVGTFIAYAIVAPIFEELCKAVSIKGEFTAEFAVVFNALEMSQYVTGIVANGGKLIDAVKIRLRAVGMHLTTTIIQWITSNKKIMEKLNIDENDKDKISFIGQLLGTIIHGIWNGLAVTDNATFKKILFSGTDLK